MRIFFFVLLVAVSGLHLLTAFECYEGKEFNVSGTETNCSTSGCCVNGVDDKGWKQRCNEFDQTGTCKWYPPFKTWICCCFKPLCNDVNSLVWKMAINRQECHVGETKSSSCYKTVPPAPESKRCHQAKFGCSVTVEGERSAVSLKYECVKKCDQQKPCQKESNGGYKCCCVGNNCNDKNFAKTALDRFCPTTTTTTTSSPTGPSVYSTTPSTSFPTYAIILIVFIIIFLILIGVGLFIYLFFVRRTWRRPKTEAPEPDSQLQPQMTSNVVASFVPSEFR